MNNNDKIKLFTDKLDLLGVEYLRDVLLSERSSFRIGGACDIAVYPHNDAQLCAALKLADEMHIRRMVVGNCSNILFDDNGFRGVLIFTKKIKNIDINGECMSVGCGNSLFSVAVAARDASLSGLEFAYGIPGSCGGAVCMNAGAYGGEMADVTESVKVYDAHTDKVETLSCDEMKFDYRKSIIGRGERYIVLGAEFRLRKDEKSKISEMMNDYMHRRTDKQPLDFPSAGSVFKRSAPTVYTGKLIEECGLKGYAIGGAQVSEKHAGFIINKGGATADDVKKLIEHIRKTVSDRYGISLECEIRMVSVE